MLNVSLQGCVEVGFLKRYLILVQTATIHLKSKWPWPQLGIKSSLIGLESWG